MVKNLDQRIDEIVKTAYEQIVKKTQKDKYTYLIEEAIGVSDNKENKFLAKLAFLVAQAANSSIELESLAPFVVACHFMQRASVVCDDIIDDDKETSLCGRYGGSRALLVGLGLWWLAEQKLIEFILQPPYPTSITSNLELLNYIHQVLFSAAKGQFSETDEPEAICTVEQCLERAGFKSGLYMEMIFKSAALAAGTPNESELVKKYALAGYHLGVLLQLAGDLASCYDADPRRNSIHQRQFTLPLAYALAESSSEVKDEILNHWQNKSAQYSPILSQEETNQKLLTLLEGTGGSSNTLLTCHHIYNQLSTLLASPQNAATTDAVLQADKAILKIAWGYLEPCTALLKIRITQEETSSTARWC